MAGSITTTVTKVAGSGGVVRTSIAWTSDALGAVSGNTVTMGPGTIVVVEFVPGTGGTQPSDLYDLTFTDDDGVNMFDDGAGASIGADLLNTTATHKVPFIGGGTVTYVRQWLHGGPYTPVIAAAGAAKTGTIIIYTAPGVV